MPDYPSLLRTIADLRSQVKTWKREGLSIGLVPTMGALHVGHMELVKTAKALCDRVIVTIFVNPTQFGENEDFDAYPRDEATDIACLKAQGIQAVFLPSNREMYPQGDITVVSLPRFNERFEGVCRPGHLDGVATVVAKLLNQVQADTAFFGEKDYQQLQLITQLARDLCIPTTIQGVPTVREADGLALSSRNAYLSDPERAVASTLNKVLQTIAKGFIAGKLAKDLEQTGLEALTSAGFGPVDYLAVVDAKTLVPLEQFDMNRPARILGAAQLGRTRLIDNVAVVPS